MSVRTQRNSLPLMCLNFKKTLLVEDWYEYFRDDFDDGIVRPEWITHGVSPPGRTITENTPPDETLDIHVTAGIDARWWRNTNAAPKIYIPLGVLAPCRITTKLNSFDADPPGSQNPETQAGIFIGYNPTGTTLLPADRYAYIWGLWDDGGIGNGFLVVANCATPTPVLAPVCALDCLPRCLRINVLATGEIEFWSVGLADGECCWTDKVWPGDWTQHPWSVPASDNYPIEDCFVGLTAKHFGAVYNAMNANFENFIVEKYEAQNPIEVECLAPIDTRAPETFYHGRIKQMSSLKRAVDDKTGLFQIADMNITLANENKHYSQKMASQFLKNQEATLYHAWTEEEEADKAEIIKLIVEDHSMKGPGFIVNFKDITQKYFTKKIPENICTVDDFPHIHPDHEGRFMPEILGNASLPDSYEHPGAVEAVYVDTAGPPWRCLASAGVITIPADEVWVDDVEQEEGAGNAYTVQYADGHTFIHFLAGHNPGDNPTIAFNAHGYSVPVWDSVNDYVQNLAYIIQYLLRFIMDIPHSLVNSPSFATLAGYYEDMGVEENGYLILQDRVDAMEVLRQLLFTGGAKGFMALDGKFEVARKNICNWTITPGGPAHIFEQIELFGSPHRKWNLTSAVNTVNVQFGYVPWQNLYTGAKSEYRDNRYEHTMEDDIRDREPRRK